MDPCVALVALKIKRDPASITNCSWNYIMIRYVHRAFVATSLISAVIKHMPFKVENGVFEVKAVAGDTNLGGEDFDNCIDGRKRVVVAAV